MEAITISPITHDGILLFACTFCYGHVKFSLYQLQQTLESLFTERMKIFPFRPFAINTVFEQKATYKECDTFIVTVQLCNCISL